MGKKTKITLGKIIDEIVIQYGVGTYRKDVRKPWSWALYQTWKWCDSVEKPKEDKEKQE